MKVPVHLHNSSKISHKEGFGSEPGFRIRKNKLWDPGGPKTYGSGCEFRMRIRNTPVMSILLLQT
jgi:hypothetical protein